MPKDYPYLRVALSALTTKEATELFAKMAKTMADSTAKVNKLAASLPSPWAYGTVWRHKVTDEYAMAVGYRQVISLSDRRAWVEDTTEGWYDYWTPVK